MDSATATSKPPDNNSETFADKNAKHFDKVAAVPGSYPQWVVDLHKQITDFLESPECPHWLGVPAASGNGARRMLDYACGDGVLTRSLRPHFPRAVGADVSERMLDRYRATASLLGLGPEAMVAVNVDLVGTGGDSNETDVAAESQLPAGETLRDFDLICVGLALHHFEDPDAALRRLVARMRSGGTLLIIDWAPINDSTPAQRAYKDELRQLGVVFEDVRAAIRIQAANHAVSRPDGFAEQEMTRLFEQAGCREVRWKLAEELSYAPVVEHAKGQLFWARATKP